MKAGFIGFKSSQSICLRRYLCAINTPFPCQYWGASRKVHFPACYFHVEKKISVLSQFTLDYFSPLPLTDLKCGFHIDLLDKAQRHLYYI